MTSITSCANELKQARDNLSSYKKDNEDIFKQLVLLKGLVKEAGATLTIKMIEENETSFEIDGMEFEVKQVVRPFHTMDAIKHAIENEVKLDEYLKTVNITKSNLAARKSKKRKVKAVEEVEEVTN